MPFSVVMPALEMAQETGKLVSWLKKEGEAVRKGEPLLEIETDKAVMEIESPGDGFLAGVKIQPGAEVPVGKTIAWIVGAGEAPPAEEGHVESGRRTTTTATSPPAAAAPSVAPTPEKSARVSPKARRLAAEKGVDLSKLPGSGPGGEILADDILKAASMPASSAAPGSFARLMADRTLVRHRRMNASWTREGLRENREVNIGLAIATEDAVVAPVIHNAPAATLAEIAARRRELTERARAGKLHPSDLSGGTFTLSNLGMLEVDAFSAIITPPQVAILAVGRVADRVVAVDGQPAVRPMITMTLSSDHRAISGAHAAEFMRDLAAAIGNPLTGRS